jgi:dihydrofolate reductase
VIISLIAAIDQAGGIGVENRLPWRLSADLQRFKQLTWGHHLVAGRKTFASIGRPLPGRTMLVISRHPQDLPPGCLPAGSLEAALSICAVHGESEVFIIGGGEIFRLALPLAQRIYLTSVHTNTHCDTFFPPLAPGEWWVLEEHFIPADEKNEYPSTFRILERAEVNLEHIV